MVLVIQIGVVVWQSEGEFINGMVLMGLVGGVNCYVFLLAFLCSPGKTTINQAECETPGVEVEFQEIEKHIV